MANMETIVPHLEADMGAGNASVLISPPGYGKTDLINNVMFPRFKKRHEGKKVGLCRTFLAYQDNVDASGLPWPKHIEIEGKKYGITDPLMPTWFVSTEGRPADTYDIVLMVLEEWGQGGGDTKKAFAPLLLEGGIGQYRLPTGSPRIALTNVDSRDGVTKEYDFVIGRRGEWPISGDVKPWLNWADKPYEHEGKSWLTMPITKFWAKQNPQVLFEDKPDKQGPWCSPRTTCMADRYTQMVAEASKGVIPVDDPVYAQGLEGQDRHERHHFVSRARSSFGLSFRPMRMWSAIPLVRRCQRLPT